MVVIYTLEYKGGNILDRLYVIYCKDKKLKTSSNGYNTKRGTNAALTMLVKKDCPEDWEEEREKYSIKEFISKEELTFKNVFKKIFRREL